MQALWFWLVSVMVAVYAVLDGYDFGVGVLHRYVARTDSERREVLGAIGPFWDGNEVWLLAGGGALFVAFPGVLAAGFSGLYLAMFLVLWTLILRGISIEFRSHLKDGLWRSFWDSCFVFASTLMPLFLGVALGNVVRGVPLDAQGQFNLPLFTSFLPTGDVGILDIYTVTVGLLVWVTLVSHGALFLVWKTTGAVRERAAALVRPMWTLTLVFAVVATFATAKVTPALYAALPSSPLAWVGLALYLSSSLLVFWFHRQGKALFAFLGSSAFILGILVATAACTFPVMLRSTTDPQLSLTAYNASASANGLSAGAVWWFIGFPIALGYVFFLQYLHRGKAPSAKDGEGY
jgi:cytochrome d ubiquinol oxidase subunit II